MEERFHYFACLLVQIKFKIQTSKTVMQLLEEQFITQKTDQFYQTILSKTTQLSTDPTSLHTQ